jgi:hypothetical protein
MKNNGSTGSLNVQELAFTVLPGMEKKMLYLYCRTTEYRKQKP